MSTNDQELRKIQLKRISHVYYTHASSSIAKQKEFLADFGLFECASPSPSADKTYYRGYGIDPWVYCLSSGDEDKFGGAGFVVESLEDLQYAAKTLPEATPVYDLKDSPGGGKGLTFKDPVDKFPMHLVWGQEERKPDSDEELSFPKIDFNFPRVKTRPANKFQRFEKRPAPVHKLGHFGMVVTDFAKTYEFYQSRFNLIASDLLHTPTGHNVTAFNRIDRGPDTLVDHHTFFFFEGPKSHVHHASFETHDFDTQVLGHDWLRHKGYEICWGVGRHIMGSQIFDYWFDPSKFILEHYVDGDLMNNKVPTNVGVASHDDLAVWGPDLPETFLT
ncbi:Metapyrocatechase 2 [Lachnellula cervina]|uniref:Metapyrocatechase 2 n=1 Tax=Lachnellula cervina TaxID=1316786 RepID=A0A7D8YP05_9HELO|nr:Metapyrocatechase 2 [Lachnellula cervina]